MNPRLVADIFAALSTPLVADACLRLGVKMMLAPPGLRPVRGGSRVAGKVLPARHYGSVDVFLEAYELAEGGEVIVIDNGGRTDEACIGDLTVLEAQAAGLVGMVVWGFHRDSAELRDIDFPVFTYGAFPTGPRRLDVAEPDALASAAIGDGRVGSDHFVFADDDGAVFVPKTDVNEVLATAQTIFEAERKQAELIGKGSTLRDQLRFSEYLQTRSRDPSYSFRRHIRSIAGAIEE